MKKILVLGCGLKRYPHAIHVDINPEVNPNIVWDLNKYPWPFEDNRFKNIIAEHILEHIWVQGDVEGFFKLWKEIWRICKNDAEINVEVPYCMHSLAYSDPGHKSFWGREIFLFVSKKEYERNRKMKSMMTQYNIDFDFDITHLILVKQNQNDLIPIFLRATLKVIK